MLMPSSSYLMSFLSFTQPSNLVIITPCSNYGHCYMHKSIVFHRKLYKWVPVIVYEVTKPLWWEVPITSANPVKSTNITIWTKSLPNAGAPLPSPHLISIFPNWGLHPQTPSDHHGLALWIAYVTTNFLYFWCCSYLAQIFSCIIYYHIFSPSIWYCYYIFLYMYIYIQLSPVAHLSYFQLEKVIRNQDIQKIDRSNGKFGVSKYKGVWFIL